MGGKGSKQQPPQRGVAEGTGDAYKTATGDQQQNGASSTTEDDIKTTTPSPTVDVTAPTVAPAEQSPTTLSKSHPLAAYMHPAAAAAATTAPLKTVKVIFFIPRVGALIAPVRIPGSARGSQIFCTDNIVTMANYRHCPLTCVSSDP